MKKLLCLILTVVIALGCMAVPANAAQTENGVQVEIAPFLYKSTLYPMEFPSRQSYDVKEKSDAGDCAVSRELNDLAYTFVFPAGTTAFACNVSLDGEVWHGFSLNDEKNPNYWEKNADGTIDYTQPLTFRRIASVAEQDEYGILYREHLWGTDAQGFKDFDKIYWRLVYTCNDTEYTQYFDIKLYDYDASEKYAVKTVNFNVYGLPFAALNRADLNANHAVAADYFNKNDFDIVAVQEDFGYHDTLVANLNGYNYMTNHTGSVPGGDGLNIFTADMAVYNETRVTWDDACGILSDGSDELTPKGFVYTVIDIGNGIYVDFYNLHADAYGGEGSVAARTSQYKQLAAFIQARSAEHDRPVIVTGDFNNHLHYREDNAALYNILTVELGLKDAFVEVKNNGDYFDFSQWHATGLPAWGNWDSIERFMYRAGGGVDVIATDLRYTEVVNENGEVISDHNAAECDFTFVKTADFVENTQELQVTQPVANSFMNRILWLFKALFMILSDLGNLPALLEEIA